MRKKIFLIEERLISVEGIIETVKFPTVITVIIKVRFISECKYHQVKNH